MWASALSSILSGRQRYSISKVGFNGKINQIHKSRDKQRVKREMLVQFAVILLVKKLVK